MPGQTTVNIFGYTVDDNIVNSDGLFDLGTGATLVLLGENKLTDDAVEGFGRVSVRGPTTIDDGLVLTGSSLFVNTDSLTQNDGDLVLGQSESDTVNARNIADAVWTLTNSASIDSSGESQFVNLGLLIQTGDAGLSTIDANFYDRGGTIRVDGTLQFNSPGLVNRFIDDQLTGSGFLELGLGSEAVLVGSNVSTANTYFVDARVVDNVTVSSATVSIRYVNLGAGSNLLLTDTGATIEGTSPEFVGTGTLQLKGSDTDNTSGNFDLVGAVTLDNFGYFKFSSDATQGSYFNASELDASAWAGNQIVIENNVGATWEEEGNFGYFVSDGGGVATFRNDGTFVSKTSSGATTFEMAVVNNGVMGGPGPLAFDDAVTGVGTIDVGADQVAINALLGSGQTLQFSAVTSGAPDPTLTLLDLSEFSGLVAGFDKAGATDDQLVVNASHWTYHGYVANSDGASGSLVFSNSGSEAAVNLSGAYDPTGFHASFSGSQTTITYSV